MARRWHGRGIALGGLAVLLILCAVDLARGYFRGISDEQFRVEHGDLTPPFKIGDPAPDFTLPDQAGKAHTLSSVVRGDTMLCFLCGCSECRHAQTFLGALLRKLGSRAPRVVSVTSAPPEAEAAWKRDTRLPQTMLYDSKANQTPVIRLYRGHPCPRLYRLGADRRVTWIGPSPQELPTMTEMGRLMEQNLGVSAEDPTTHARP